MRRRDFIALVGGAAVAAPLARVRSSHRYRWSASFTAKHPMLCVLKSSRSSRAKRSGFTEGQNVAIEYRWAEGQFDKIPELLADLADRALSTPTRS